MKVEILYIAQCPSHPGAVKLVRDVLSAEGVTAEIREVLVTDERMVQDLAFPGSPTIRINGRDVAEPPELNVFAFSCRLYPGSSQMGLPQAHLIRRAVQKARQEKAH